MVLLTNASGPRLVLEAPLGTCNDLARDLPDGHLRVLLQRILTEARSNSDHSFYERRDRPFTRSAPARSRPGGEETSCADSPMNAKEGNARAGAHPSEPPGPRPHAANNVQEHNELGVAGGVERRTRFLVSPSRGHGVAGRS